MSSAARRYHWATKHSFWSVRRGSRFLDWDNRPHPFKVYEGLPRVDLPRRPPPVGVSALEALAGRGRGRPARMDPVSLARLLFLSAGVLRVVQFPG